MPFKKKVPLSKYNEINLSGAYFRNHRITDGLSLVYVAENISMNKGYLSDIENGKRPFSKGVILQLNQFYDINFEEDESEYKSLKTCLHDAFNAMFNYNSLKESEILNSSNILNHHKENSGYFILQILKLFHAIRIDEKPDTINTCKAIIENNLDAVESDDLAIFYCLLGIYYKRDTSTNYLAEEYLKKSIALSSIDSKVYALCQFEMISILAETNRSVLGYSYCEQSKNIFTRFNNYTTLFFIDLFQYNCLINAGLYEEAIKGLNELLKNINEENEKYKYAIYHSIAWGQLLNHNYLDCVQATNEARNEEDKSEDLLYFISFSYYKLNQPLKALDFIEETLPKCTSIYKEFLIAIKARIQKDNELFEQKILYFYNFLLSHYDYETILFVLEFILDYFKEINQIHNIIATYDDYKMLKENKLTFETSSLLKKFREKV